MSLIKNIAFIYLGYSIQCYNCTSNTNPDCSDVTKLDQFILNCTGVQSPVEGSNQTSTFCRKILQTIDFKQNGRKLFIG